MKSLPGVIKCSVKPENILLNPAIKEACDNAVLALKKQAELEQESRRCKGNGMTVGDFIKQLEPYRDFEMRTMVQLEVCEEELQKRTYQYPYDLYEAELKVNDIGHSDRTVMLGVSIVNDYARENGGFSRDREEPVEME